MIFQKLPRCRMGVSWTRRYAAHRNEGYALISTMLVAYIVLMLGLAVITLALYENRATDRWRKSSEAYFLARAAMAEAIYRLKTDYANVTTDRFISEPQALSPNDDLERRSFRYAMEPAGNIHFIGTQYMTGAFKVEALGVRGYKRRGIEMRVERDTFLRYSRFVQSSQSDLSYAANANIIGDLYAGKDLNLNGAPVTFWGDVEIGGSINNEWRGTFHGDISGIGEGVDLVESVNISHYRDLARGLLPGEGTGLYLSSATSIDLNLFDFTGPNPKYDGNTLPADFNGVIFCERDISIAGTLEGQSLTFFSKDDIIATGDIRTGNTMESTDRINPPMVFNSQQGTEQIMTRNLDGIVGTDTNVFKLRVSGTKWNKLRMYILEDGVRIPNKQVDIVRQPASPDEQVVMINNLNIDPGAHTYSAEVHYWSDGNGDNPTWVEAWNGDPVNIGLVAKDMFYISSSTPRQLSIDAAILTRDRTWNALGDWSSHPDGYDPGVWELTMTGPIITMNGGSAGPWSSYGTRRYDYDMDMVEHAPPYFPVPSDWWKLAYWWHLKEREITI